MWVWLCVLDPALTQRAIGPKAPLRPAKRTRRPQKALAAVDPALCRRSERLIGVEPVNYKDTGGSDCVVLVLDTHKGYASGLMHSCHDNDIYSRHECTQWSALTDSAILRIVLHAN